MYNVNRKHVTFIHISFPFGEVNSVIPPFSVASENVFKSEKKKKKGTMNITHKEM